MYRTGAEFGCSLDGVWTEIGRRVETGDSSEFTAGSPVSAEYSGPRGVGGSTLAEPYEISTHS
eukprot:9476449-Pyramimonas_sp.AAC.1